MIPYIINAGLILAGCLAFYKLLLQKETFYKLNRYVLVICIVTSFSLPLLPVPQQWSFRKVDEVPTLTVPAEKQEVNTTPINTITPPLQQTANTSAEPFTFRKALTWVMYLYWFGVAVFSLSFLAQIAVLLYRAYTRPSIRDGRFRIVEVSGNKAPCSFANNIFINPEKYDWETYNQILMHEKVHIMQGHTLDIVLAEIVLVFQWFNPFAWVYRKEVENNLEFLTDNDLVQRKGLEPSSYQMSLLKVSAPHFPLSLTTNYNQSLLKKRIAMMNAKKSNVHTTWKYLFLLPLLVMFACLLNKPVAYGQREKSTRDNIVKKGNAPHVSDEDITTEGVWFATIKNEKIYIRFKREGEEDDSRSYNGNTFALSEFTDLPRNGSGSFSLTRDAGTMRFKGRFEGNEGMGQYQFVPNESYANFMQDQGVGKLNDHDLMVFFFVDVTKSYVGMLKDQGFRGFDKDDLIPMAALHVDDDFIRGIREAGYKDVEMQTLVSLKALGVDKNYIREIRNAGYKNIDLDKIIAFKAQGIDGDYLARLQKANADESRTNNNNNNNNRRNNNKNSDEALSDKERDDANDNNKDQARGYGMSADDIIAFKALQVDDEFINSFREVGYNNISNSDIIAMKSLNITPAYIKAVQNMGYSRVSLSNIIAFKAQNVTPEYIRSFESVGYSNIPISDIVAFKSQNVTPEFIRGFESVGFRNISLGNVSALKALNITPGYISNMREKGFNYNNIDKYIQLKAVTD